MAHATLASESTIDALLEMSTSPHRMRGLEARAKPGWGVLAEEAPKPAAQQTSHGSATSSGSRSPSTESPNLFEDNEPRFSACAKGRSPTFRVNQLLRRKGSLEVAARQKSFLRWVATRHQPAGWLSRER